MKTNIYTTIPIQNFTIDENCKQSLIILKQLSLTHMIIL